MVIDLKIGDIVLGGPELLKSKRLFNKKFYVYELIDSSNDKTFYVGKGQKYRCFSHLYASRNNRITNQNLKLSNKINKLLENKIEVKYKIPFQSDTEEECFLLEELLIKEFGIDNLCNIELSNRGIKHTEETKDKIRQAHLGKKLSDKTKLKLRNINLGKIVSNEVKEKVSNGLKKAYKNNSRTSWNKGLNKINDPRIALQSEKLIGVNKGFKHSEETINKMKLTHKGKIISELTRDKIRKSLIKEKTIKKTNCQICGIEITNLIVIGGKTKEKRVCSMKCSAQVANRTKKLNK